MAAELKHARHDLRGRLNALKLSMTALDILQTTEDKLEFLGMIEQAADQTAAALDHFEAIHDRTPDAERGEL